MKKIFINGSLTSSILEKNPSIPIIKLRNNLCVKNTAQKGTMFLTSVISYFSHQELKCSNYFCSIDGDLYIIVAKPTLAQDHETHQQKMKRRYSTNIPCFATVITAWLYAHFLKLQSFFRFVKHFSGMCTITLAKQFYLAFKVLFLFLKIRLCLGKPWCSVLWGKSVYSYIMKIRENMSLGNDS